MPRMLVPPITAKTAVIGGNGILPASPITAKTSFIGDTGIGGTIIGNKLSAVSYTGQPLYETLQYFTWQII